MISVYLRLAMYGVIAAALIALGWWINGLRWEDKYNTLITADATAVATAQHNADVRAASIAAAYDAKLQETDNAYQQNLTSANTRGDSLAVSLRNYARRRCLNNVSAGTSTAGTVHDTAGSASTDDQIADVARQLFEAIGRDDAKLTGLQAERASINTVIVTTSKAK